MRLSRTMNQLKCMIIFLAFASFIVKSKVHALSLEEKLRCSLTVPWMESNVPSSEDLDILISEVIGSSQADDAKNKDFFEGQVLLTTSPSPEESTHLEDPSTPTRHLDGKMTARTPKLEKSVDARTPEPRPEVDLEDQVKGLQVLLVNVLTKLVLKEMRKVDFLQHLPPYALVSTFWPEIAVPSPSNHYRAYLMPQEDPLYDVSDSSRRAKCKVTRVTVYFCTISIFHIGTLPKDLVEAFDEDQIVDLVCPCSRPIIGYFCPSSTRDLVFTRFNKRCNDEAQ